VHNVADRNDPTFAKRSNARTRLCVAEITNRGWDHRPFPMALDRPIGKPMTFLIRSGTVHAICVLRE
jgi:hypothetical protein